MPMYNFCYYNFNTQIVRLYLNTQIVVFAQCAADTKLCTCYLGVTPATNGYDCRYCKNINYFNACEYVMLIMSKECEDKKN